MRVAVVRSDGQGHAGLAVSKQVVAVGRAVVQLRVYGMGRVGVIRAAGLEGGMVGKSEAGWQGAQRLTVLGWNEVGPKLVIRKEKWRLAAVLFVSWSKQSAHFCLLPLRLDPPLFAFL